MTPFSFSPAILLPLLLILSIKLSNSLGNERPATIYDVLKLNGLPIGLLPNGIANFSVDGQGKFEVHLDQACDAKFENQVHYDRNISGTLSFGKIGALSGISAKELFLWFPVKGIRVDVPSSGLIYFDVGVIYKQFSLSLFEAPPACNAADRLSSPDFHEGKRTVESIVKSSRTKVGYEYDHYTAVL